MKISKGTATFHCIGSNMESNGKEDWFRNKQLAKLSSCSLVVLAIIKFPVPIPIFCRAVKPHAPLYHSHCFIYIINILETSLYNWTQGR